MLFFLSLLLLLLIFYLAAVNRRQHVPRFCALTPTLDSVKLTFGKNNKKDEKEKEKHSFSSLTA